MVAWLPENAFVLSLFQFLMAGLIFLVLIYLMWTDKEKLRRDLSLWALGFFFLASHYFTRSVDFYRDLAATETTTDASAHYLIALLESAAILSLALFFLEVPERYRRRVALAMLALAPLIAWAGLRTSLLRANFEPVSPVAALYALVLLPSLVRALGRKDLLTSAVVGSLVLVKLAEFSQLHFSDPRRLTLLWNAENLLTLLNLVAFAFYVERKSRSIPLQFFIRLNVAFLVLASILIVILIDEEREQYLFFAEQNLQDLSEFLRGHLLYYHSQGQDPRTILDNPGIHHKLIADLGRHPDLREVNIQLMGQGFSMQIDPSGLISTSLDPEPAKPSIQERKIVVVSLPILYKERPIGNIELVETVRTIQSRILKQIRTIYVAFTIAVFASALIIGFTIWNANRTIRKQQEEIIATQQQLFNTAKLASVGYLTSGVAHEINNPAGIILTTADYLVRNLEQIPDRFREDIEVIRRQAQRISRIIRDLLTFSRPSSVRKEPLDIRPLLDRCLAFMEPHFRTQGIQVEKTWSPFPLIVQAEPDHLQQVFVNLLSNARDAMTSGGTLTLETGIQPDGGAHVYVRVRDTGCGISREHLNKIFDPFFTTKENGAGTGLGLSISYGIIRDHHGSILVDSALGEGSTFTVLLPRSEEKEDG